MARVEISSQAWGWLVDSNGNPLGSTTATLKNLDATDATTWSLVSGGSSSTSALTSNSDGTLSRFVEEGTYTLTVGATTRRVEAVAGISRQVWLNDYIDLAPSGVWDAALDAAIAALPGSRGTVHVGTLAAGASYIFDAAHTLAHGQYLKGPATRSGVPAVNFTCRLNGVQWIVSAGNGSGFENITFTGDVTKAGQDPLVDLGHATDPITSGTLKGCLVQNSGGHGIRVRNCIGWDFAFTYAYGCVLSGWKIQGFSNTNTWGKAGATNNLRWGVDYYGGTGNDFGAFQFENNSLENVGQAVTAVAATDLFTKTAHGYSAGDKVAFTGLTGGAGITAGQPYEVIASGLTANAFKVADITTAVTLDVTSDLTAGTVTRVYGGIRFRGGTEQDYTINAVFTAPRFENNDGPSGGGVSLQIDAEGTGRQSVKFVGDLYSLDRSPTINGGIFYSLGCVTDQTVLGNVASTCRAAVWELPSGNTGTPTFTINDPGGKSHIRHITHTVVGADSQVAFGIRKTGDTSSRLIIIPKAGGGPQIQMGPGNATQDVTLDRDAADVIGTDDGLRFRDATGKGYIQFAEASADPAAPSANNVRIFAKDNGAGKTQFVARFPTGATVVIATEP